MTPIVITRLQDVPAAIEHGQQVIIDVWPSADLEDQTPAERAFALRDRIAAAIADRTATTDKDNTGERIGRQ